MHKFFHDFNVGSNRPRNTSDERYLYNTMILEISNNWAFVSWLYYRYKEKILKDVDNLEKTWLDFMLKNAIDPLRYGKEGVERFVEERLKK